MVPVKSKKRLEEFKPIKKEEFKKNKLTGHPSLPFSMNRKFTKAIDFTHDSKEDIDEKEELKKNINPKDNSKCYVKIKVSKIKNNKYKEAPEYSEYRIHQKDRELIEQIKSGTYKKRRANCSSVERAHHLL